MLIFNPKFSLDLKISKREFIDKLILITNIQDNIDQEIIPSNSRKYLGFLDYNTFKLTKNKSALFNINFAIEGEISEINDKVQIDGKITGHIFTLVTVLSYTLICVTFALFFWISKHPFSDILPFLVFGPIGLYNTYSLINGLNRLKKDFIGDISFTK